MARDRIHSYPTLLLVASTIVMCSQQLPAQHKFVKPISSVVLAEGYFNANAKKVIPSGVLDSQKLSANAIGNVLTLLFDDAKLSLQTENDPLVATWVGTVVVPTKSSATNRPTSYLQHVRGFVAKDKDSSVTIVLSLGGRTQIVSYGYGVKTNQDILRTFITPLKPQLNTYVASLAIIVERRNLKSAVQVDVDSLDVDARLPASPHKK